MSATFRGPGVVRLGVVPYAAVVGKQQQTALNRRGGIQNGIDRLVKTYLRPQRTRGEPDLRSMAASFAKHRVSHV
jgi:hypothetical protein